MKPIALTVALAVLLASAAAPLASGHRAAGIAGNLANVPLDGIEASGLADRGCRYTPAPGCFTHAGVSGNYVGSAGPFLALAGPPLAGGQAFCDFEVLSDGSAPGDPLDEANVDGFVGPAGLPDGTWDDGGEGAACHTPAGFYDFAPYNSPGTCAGVAHAEDVAVGSDVWIGVSCDFIDAATGMCGNDGVGDAIAYGTGGGDLPGAGVPYPPVVPAVCAPLAVPTVFVFTAVEVTVAPGTSVVYDAALPPGLGNPAVAVGGLAPAGFVAAPVAGWIDWTAAGPAVAWVPPAPLVTVLLPECSDLADNDGDGEPDWPGEVADDVADDFLLGDTDGDGAGSCATPLDPVE